MTLHYYSSKAYGYVCKIITLPHACSIRAWADSVDCEPGYLTNVIKILTNTAKTKKWITDVVFMVDAVTLHKYGTPRQILCQYN